MLRHMDFVPKKFVKGKRYGAKKRFMKGIATFTVGEVLLFEFDGFGRYDEAFGYTFHSLTDGTTKTWMLFEGESVDSWREFFEPLE